ncbi:arylamine N-acetyltransferase [Paenibacillus piri]|uniref:Arylamine N-acetyltransferase n=1 Tax=Paenibacillus piri TaxID=2547395 RepID=A0A4V2ZTH7_9BACL|nr:arylamine N-acetyltransferase [Paenibacillus piri]TDF97084.1 hypothetical protein E1757_14660 [Paenibacillus piri]
MDNSVIQRYLMCLDTEHRPPTMDYLRNLIKLHLRRFPFENLSKFHYYLHQGKTGLDWLPDIETYLDHFVNKGMGGNCYILNVHFGSLLRGLGFQTNFVRATGGNTHLGLMVTVDGQSYYVDVGYGAPLFDPLYLEEQPRFTRFGEEVEISRLLPDNHYMIDRRSNGHSLVTKCIEWKPVGLESFDEVIAHSLRDEDENPFMRRIVATLFRLDAAYSVVNRKLFIKSDRGVESHEYTQKNDWMDMMRTTFGFEHDLVEQALDFLKEREVRLF